MMIVQWLTLQTIEFNYYVQAIAYAEGLRKIYVQQRNACRSAAFHIVVKASRYPMGSRSVGTRVQRSC